MKLIQIINFNCVLKFELQITFNSLTFFYEYIVLLIFSVTQKYAVVGKLTKINDGAVHKTTINNNRNIDYRTKL